MEEVRRDLYGREYTEVEWQKRDLNDILNNARIYDGSQITNTIEKLVRAVVQEEKGKA